MFSFSNSTARAALVLLALNLSSGVAFGQAAVSGGLTSPPAQAQKRAVLAHEARPISKRSPGGASLLAAPTADEQPQQAPSPKKSPPPPPMAPKPPTTVALGSGATSETPVKETKMLAVAAGPAVKREASDPSQSLSANKSAVDGGNQPGNTVNLADDQHLKQLHYYSSATSQFLTPIMSSFAGFTMLVGVVGSCLMLVV